MTNKSTLILDLDPNTLDGLEDWLRENVGLGGRRYAGKDGGNTHWLGPDDWMYYLEEQEEGAEKSRVTFVFRRESDAVMFSLKW